MPNATLQKSKPKVSVVIVHGRCEVPEPTNKKTKFLQMSGIRSYEAAERWGANNNLSTVYWHLGMSRVFGHQVVQSDAKQKTKETQ